MCGKLFQKFDLAVELEASKKEVVIFPKTPLELEGGCVSDQLPERFDSVLAVGPAVGLARGLTHLGRLDANGFCDIVDVRRSIAELANRYLIGRGQIEEYVLCATALDFRNDRRFSWLLVVRRDRESPHRYRVWHTINRLAHERACSPAV